MYSKMHNFVAQSFKKKFKVITVVLCTLIIIFTTLSYPGEQSKNFNGIFL